MVHCWFAPRHFKEVSGHHSRLNVRAVCLRPLPRMYQERGGGSPKGQIQTKDTLFPQLPPPRRRSARRGRYSSLGSGLPLLDEGQKRRGAAAGGEGGGLGLRPCRENLLPPAAAGARCSAGPRSVARCSAVQRRAAFACRPFPPAPRWSCPTSSSARMYFISTKGGGEGRVPPKKVVAVEYGMTQLIKGHFGGQFYYAARLTREKELF